MDQLISRVACIALATALAFSGGCESTPPAAPAEGAGAAGAAPVASTAPVHVEWYRCADKQIDEYVTPMKVSVPKAMTVYCTERPTFTEQDIARTDIIRDEDSGAPRLIAFLKPKSAEFLTSLTVRGGQQPMLAVIDGTPVAVTTAHNSAIALSVTRASPRFPDTAALNQLAKRLPPAVTPTR